MSNAVAISAANLDVLEENLHVLADNVGYVSEDINTINGHISDVEGKVQTMQGTVKSLEEEIKNFMVEIKHGTIVSNARQTILLAQKEFDTKFGYRDQVRRQVNGLLQSVDINSIKRNTMSSIGEETMLNTPDYWLAPAFVALCSWYTGNKELATRSLKEAIHRDDEKTSLLFCLIHLRAGRTNTSIKWLQRYLTMQDPSNMESKIITVLDAISSGVFGKRAQKIVIDKIQEWVMELKNFPEMKKYQIQRWTEYFKEQLDDIDEHEFPYVMRHVAEKQVFKEHLSFADFHHKILEKFKIIFEEQSSRSLTNIHKIDKLLHDLVFHFDREELALKKEVEKNKYIIEENGNMKTALEKFEKEKFLLENESDFYTHITNIALGNGHYSLDLNTHKFALAFSKDLFLEGYQNVVSSDMFQELTITIDDWKGTTTNGSNEMELQQSLSHHLDTKFHDEIYGEALFNIKMLIASFVGVIGAFLTRNYFIISVLFIIVALVFDVVEFFVIYTKREAKMKKLREIKKHDSIVLSNIVAEIVDYYFICKNSEQEKEKLIDYINKCHYEDFLVSDTKRKILIDEER